MAVLRRSPHSLANLAKKPRAKKSRIIPGSKHPVYELLSIWLTTMDRFIRRSMLEPSPATLKMPSSTPEELAESSKPDLPVRSTEHSECGSPYTSHCIFTIRWDKIRLHGKALHVLSYRPRHKCQIGTNRKLWWIFDHEADLVNDQGYRLWVCKL